MMSMARSGLVFATLAVTAAAAAGQQVDVFVEGLERPVDFAVDPTNPERYYVVEQDRGIRVIEDGTLLVEPFMLADPDNLKTYNDFWEQGVLGLAFDPGYAENRRFYVYWTDSSNATVLTRHVAATPYRADWDAGEVILRMEQPFPNHNGGCIRFGPDRMLYVGPGDGGAANDPLNHGQNTETLLGSILRIDVTGEPDEGMAYAIPDNNPFVGEEGKRAEIWAYGLRNPWRFEWDSRGNMFVADVGQNRYEWVHVIPAGSKGDNLGWKLIEGLGEFRPGRSQGRRASPDPERLDRAAIAAMGIRPPVFDYEHHPIASVTGGYFYEGDRYPWLRNRYFCADFMSGRIWSFRIRPETAAEGAEGVRAWYRPLDVVEHTEALKAAWPGGAASMQASISSFGLSADGETVFILDHKGGRVLKLVE